MKDKITDSEIMEMLLEELRYKASPFSKELGYNSSSSIYFILKGRNRITDDMIRRIIERFPEVNELFLKRGEHPVLLNISQKIGQANLLGIDLEKATFDEVPNTLRKILSALNDIKEILKQDK